MQPHYGPSSQANPINPVIPIQWSTRLCSKKNWREPSALNLGNPVTSVPSIRFLWKSKDFLVTREQKVRCHGPPGSARAQPWSIQSWNTTPSPLAYNQEVPSPHSGGQAKSFLSLCPLANKHANKLPIRKNLVLTDNWNFFSALPLLTHTDLGMLGHIWPQFWLFLLVKQFWW